MGGPRAARREEEGERLPEHLEEFVTRSSVAMEQIATVMGRQEEWMKTQWPQLVDTLNSDFLLHNQRVEQLCEVIDESNKQMLEFRKDVWDKMWNTFQRILIVAVGVLAAIAGWRIVTGM